MNVVAAPSGTKYFITFSGTANLAQMTVDATALTVTSRSTVVVDVADDEVPGVLVLQSDGSTDVVERRRKLLRGRRTASTFRSVQTDTYRVVLTQAPKPGRRSRSA